MADATININAADKTKAGFMSAQRSLQKFSASAKQTTKGLLGTITGAGLGSALGAALGINLKSISDSVARTLTGVTKDSEDALNRLVSASGATADIIARRTRSRRTDQEQITLLLEKEKKINEQIAQMSVSQKVTIGRGRGQREIDKVDEASQAALAEAELRRQQILEEIDDLRRREADKIKSLKDQLQGFEDAGIEANARLEGAVLKGRDAYDAMQGAMSRVRSEMNALNDNETIEGLLRKIELTKEQTKIATSLYELEQKAAQGQKEAAKILGQGFENAITSGEKLTDVIKQLGMDLMKLALRNTVTNPLVDFLGKSNFLGGIFKNFGGPQAAGGSVSSGKSYLVGEKGPEMFTPSSAGHIIPNNALGGSSGGARTVYNIDARGADRTGLARLEQMIRETQSSIGPIAVRSVYSAAGRGMI